jgi:hypothetical protein
MFPAADLEMANSRTMDSSNSVPSTQASDESSHLRGPIDVAEVRTRANQILLDWPAK